MNYILVRFGTLLALIACSSCTFSDDPSVKFGSAVSHTSYDGKVEIVTDRCGPCARRYAERYKKVEDNYSDFMSDIGYDLHFEVKITESPYVTAHTDLNHRPRTIVLNPEKIWELGGNVSVYLGGVDKFEPISG